MKTRIVITCISLFGAALAYGSPVHTHYECTEDSQVEGLATLSIDQDDVHATVGFHGANGEQNFTGTYSLSESSFFGKTYHYALTSEETGCGPQLLAQLDLSSHVQVTRGGCGRAGCPPPGEGGGSSSWLDATLNINGQQPVSFSCHEDIQ